MKKFLVSVLIATLALVTLLPSNAYAQVPTNVAPAAYTPQQTSPERVNNNPRRAPDGRYLRKDAHSPAAKQDLVSLAVALNKLRSMDCSEPRSWYYQGAIHWTPDTDYLQVNPFCSFFNATSYPPRTPSTLPQSWKNCTHDQESISEIHFLPWHRIYLDYFEKIVRKFSGDPDFALPYWNYTSTTDVESHRTMPEVFRTPGFSLYEESRNSGLNQGQPISNSTSASGKVFNVEQSLVDGVRTLFDNTDYATFNNRMDSDPHGVMHNYIGGIYGKESIFNPITQAPITAESKAGGGLMGLVETAGFDPIFWLHHGNIDRLWQYWTLNLKPDGTPAEQPRGQQISLDQLNSVKWQYAFFDENGELIKYDMEGVLEEINNRDYVYDNEPTPSMITAPSPIPLPELVARAKSQQREETEIISQEFQETITDKPMQLAVSFTPQTNQRSGASPSPFREGSPSLFEEVAKISSPAEQSFVIEATVSYQGEPRGVYDVYLNLPDEKAIADRDTYLAGTIAFFVPPSQERVTKTFRFDITDELKRQLTRLKEKVDNQNLRLTIFKETGAPDERITVEKVTLYKYKRQSENA